MDRLKQARPAFGTVVAVIAIVMVMTGGTAYAALNLTSKDIKNNSLKSKDIKDGTLTAKDVKDGSLSSADILDGTVDSSDVKDESLTGTDVADGSIAGADVTDQSLNGDDVGQIHGDTDIIDNTISTFDIATDAIDSDEVLDFGLSNQDVGVLFAQVAADGSISSSSGGVTSTAIGTGTYEVDFGRVISSCAYTATQGEGGVGGAGGAIVGVTDRAGNAEAVFLTTRDAAGALVNTAFQLVVVC